jgi:hypothetical protein
VALAAQQSATPDGKYNPHAKVGRALGPSNKRMQLTKLRAAPERQGKVPPCARASRMDGGTASQLIRSVGRT